MNKITIKSILYFIASLCFFIAAVRDNKFAFCPLGCCMLILGITHLNPNTKK